MHRFNRRPSASMVVALLALVVALSGTAVASGVPAQISSLISGKKIKKNSISGNRLKKNTLTGKQIKESKLGTVRHAKLADTATTATTAGTATNATNAAHAAAADTATNAGHATNADNATNASTVSIHATKLVTAASDFASAPQVPLGTKGPFSFYGKCYNTGGGTEATTYIATTSPTGMFDTESEGGNYITPSTAEDSRILQDVTTSTDNFNTGAGDKDFMATDGTTSIYGIVGLAAAKNGNPTDGNGPFGAGDKCLFGEAVFG